MSLQFPQHARMSLVVVAVAAGCLAADGCGKPVSQGQTRAIPDVESSVDNEESRRIKRIRAARTPEERQRLIAELEPLPVRFVTFFRRWEAIHSIYGLEGWSDEGYDPGKSNVSRDVQLVEATSYGLSDIENGGLHQFFGNSTGTFAPEMIEWFDRAGLPDAAAVLRDAIKVFGDDSYPRSQAGRLEILNAIPGAYNGPRSEWDPFYEMDDRLYDAVPRDVFEKGATRWIRETCGIRRLSDPPPRFISDQK